MARERKDRAATPESQEWAFPTLPVESALPALLRALGERGAAVLQAPPGAGKTTRIPLALLGAPWLEGQRIVMLEPRRLAARAAALFMARTLGEPVGATVGYRMRMDTRVGSSTRVEVVTEGVLTRMLQGDPALDGIGLVIFDEFHERSLNADLGLALALHTRTLLRDDLRILVMSATLDGEPIARLLGGEAGPVPIVTSEGRAYPVEIRHVPPRDDRASQGRRVPEAHVSATVRTALEEHDGDVLVFLPGVAEIARVEALLLSGPVPAGTFITPLHGMLSQEAQDRAIAPPHPGMRRVVLATSIAETSLTIEGVRVVVDSGFSRVPRFSPRVGMTRLETVRVTRASAEQRAGRAGRVAPGVCYRLWDAHEQHHLLAHGRPEILDADLAALALELAEAGISSPAELRWLDPPPASAYAAARELLHELDALDHAGPSGRITGHGRAIARLPLHPRLGHMLRTAKSLGGAETALACDIAAVLSERDFLRFDAGGEDADLRLRLEVLHDRAAAAHPPAARVERSAVRRVSEYAKQLRRLMGAADHASKEGGLDATGLLVALAYPDRVARRREASVGGAARYLLRNGLGATMPGSQAVAGSEWLAIAEMGGQRLEGHIYLAAPITREEIETHFVNHVVRERAVEWDSRAGAVRAREVERLGAIALSDVQIHDADPEAVTAAMLEGVRQTGLGALRWSDAARQIRERIAFLRRLDPDRWPDLSDEALMSSLEDWLAPHVHDVTRLDALRRLDLATILLARLSWDERRALDELAPTHVEVPSGSRIRIDYSDADSPVVAVRLQEVFGLVETPRVAGGRVPLTVQLLSPAHRPVQVTRDLAGFWRTGYFEVRKELKGRYPKHYWPDDPLQATSTRHVRPR